MIIIRSIRRMSEFSRNKKIKGLKIGFVPTMGALHQGHISLIRKARKENKIVIVSLFVNPIQFGPHEDFRKYPRNLRQDAFLCRKEGVDVIFFPDAQSMYPQSYKTFITVEGLSNVLCGKFRPGHFKGVANIVAKLFNIVQPDTAYFGQKDAQQAVIIRKMSSDLNIPVSIRILPTVREKDGLALSSRNIYLSRQQREQAVVLNKALGKAREMIRSGFRLSSQIINTMRHIVSSKKGALAQYICIVDPDTLEPVRWIENKKVLIAAALFLGKTRLIDNILVTPKRRKRRN